METTSSPNIGWIMYQRKLASKQVLPGPEMVQIADPTKERPPFLANYGFLPDVGFVMDYYPDFGRLRRLLRDGILVVLGVAAFVVLVVHLTTVAKAEEHPYRNHLVDALSNFGPVGQLAGVAAGFVIDHSNTTKEILLAGIVVMIGIIIAACYLVPPMLAPVQSCVDLMRCAVWNALLITFVFAVVLLALLLFS